MPYATGHAYQALNCLSEHVTSIDYITNSIYGCHNGSKSDVLAS